MPTKDSAVTFIRDYLEHHVREISLDILQAALADGPVNLSVRMDPRGVEVLEDVGLAVPVPQVGDDPDPGDPEQDDDLLGCIDALRVELAATQTALSDANAKLAAYSAEKAAEVPGPTVNEPPPVVTTNVIGS